MVSLSLYAQRHDNLCNVNITNTKALLGLEFQTQLSVAQKIIALAMIGRDAELADSLAMLFRGIALVREPVVLGIFLRQPVHIVVTISLGEDRSRRNREILAVALHNRRVRERFLLTVYS